MIPEVIQQWVPWFKIPNIERGIAKMHRSGSGFACPARKYTGGIFLPYYSTVVNRHGLNTLPNSPIRFGTSSMIPVPDTSQSSVRQRTIPVPDTSQSSARLPYRSPTLIKVWYDDLTGTRHFPKFGTHANQKDSGYLYTVYPTEHTLFSSKFVVRCEIQ